MGLNNEDAIGLISVVKDIIKQEKINDSKNLEYSYFGVVDAVNVGGTFNIKIPTDDSIYPNLLNQSGTRLNIGDTVIIQSRNNNMGNAYISSKSGATIDGSESSSGYTGSQGVTGFTGSRGYTGSQGVGYTGSASTIIGYTGSQGIQGFTGSQGIIGFTGSIGYTGSFGYVGSQGLIGFTGSKGDLGYTGSQGIQGIIGFSGSQGVQGIIGYTGSKGEQGIIGFTGSQGITGYIGSQGIQGIQGYTGSQGIQGITGFTGSVGFVGSQGVIGYTGSRGLIGYTGSRGYTGSMASYLSAGMVTLPTFVDNGNDTITVGNGEARLFSDPDFIGVISEYTITGGIIAITEPILSNYLVVNYNGGSPIYQIVSNVELINESTIIPVYSLYYDAGEILPLNWDRLGLGLSNKIHQRLVKTRKFERESGFALSETPTRIINVSEGTLWYGAVRNAMQDVISNVDVCHFHYHVGGVYTKSNITQYNNTQYDNGTNLVTLNNNYYTVNWIYRIIEDSGHIGVVLGDNEYNQLSLALESQPRADLPEIVRVGAMLVGRIIVQKSIDTAARIESAFTSSFYTTPINTHNDLAGLQGGATSDYQHLTTTQMTSFTNKLDKSTWELINRFGFTNNNETTIAFDGINTFSLSRTGASFSYFRSGKLYTITTNKSVILSATPPATAGKYFIYIDDEIGTLTASVVPWSFTGTQVPVAIVYWDNTQTPKYFLNEERHTCSIDRAVHRYEHETMGTQLISGGVVSGCTPGSVTDTDKTFGISQTEIADENLFQTLSALIDPNGITTPYEVLYRVGTAWKWQLSNMPFKYTTTGFVEYDNSGTMTPISANTYANTYLIASNIQGDGRFIIISGKQAFPNASSAYSEKISDLDLTNFVTSEFVALYQFTWNGQAGAGTGQCKLDRFARIEGNLISTTVVATVEHNGLSGIQGGAVGDYYHIIGSKASIVNDLSDIGGKLGYKGSVPTGYTGSQGYTGSVGFIGSRGYSGSVGYTGSQGIQGIIGYTGSQGIQGIIGYTGSKGIDGVIGYNGSVGYTGSRGATGYTGSASTVIGYTGSQGIQGVIGYTGSSGGGGGDMTDVAFLQRQNTEIIGNLPNIDADLFNGYGISHFATSQNIIDINASLTVNDFAFSDFKDFSIPAGEYTVNSDTKLNPPYVGMVTGRISVKRYADLVWIELRPKDNIYIYRLSYSTATGWVGWSNSSIALTATNAVNSDKIDNVHLANLAESQTLSTVDLNTVIKSGMYRLSSGNTNAPAGADWSQLIVAHGGGDTITQMLTSYTNAKTFVRSGNPTNVGGVGTWTTWKELISTEGATMAGILTAQSNTSYTTKQVRNIIISTADAVLASMGNGDIWIKV